LLLPTRLLLPFLRSVPRCLHVLFTLVYCIRCCSRLRLFGAFVVRLLFWLIVVVRLDLLRLSLFTLRFRCVTLSRCLRYVDRLFVRCSLFVVLLLPRCCVFCCCCCSLRSLAFLSTFRFSFEFRLLRFVVHLCSFTFLFVAISLFHRLFTFRSLLRSTVTAFAVYRYVSFVRCVAVYVHVRCVTFVVLPFVCVYVAIFTAALTFAFGHVVVPR